MQSSGWCEMIDFKNKNKILLLLNDNFPVQNSIDISLDLLVQYEGDVVYDYFHGNTWFDLASHLDFKLDGEALEKGCLCLKRDEFRYYFPLYIYASLINDDGWAFEYSFFLHYLTPGTIDEDDFFDFIDRFNFSQKKIIYEFVLYKFVHIHDPIAEDAFNHFWILYS